MRILLLIPILLAVSSATAEPNSQTGCYKALTRSIRAPAAASDSAWDRLLEAKIDAVTTNCANHASEDCWRDLAARLELCGGVGGKKFQNYVYETWRSSVAHLPQPPTTPMADPAAGQQ